MHELKSLARIESDGKWLQSHLDEIRAKFVNQFVAVRNRQVIAHDNDPEVLIKSIKSEKEEPNEVLIEFIHKKDLKILL